MESRYESDKSGERKETRSNFEPGNSSKKELFTPARPSRAQVRNLSTLRIDSPSEWVRGRAAESHDKSKREPE